MSTGLKLFAQLLGTIRYAVEQCACPSDEFFSHLNKRGVQYLLEGLDKLQKETNNEEREKIFNMMSKNVANCWSAEFFTKYICRDTNDLKLCVSGDFKTDKGTVVTQGWMGMRLMHEFTKQDLFNYADDVCDPIMSTQIEKILTGNGDNIYVMDIGTKEIKLIQAGRFNEKDAKKMMPSDILFEKLRNGMTLDDLQDKIVDFIRKEINWTNDDGSKQFFKVIVYGTAKFRKMFPQFQMDIPLFDHMDVVFEILSQEKEAILGFCAAACAQRFSGQLNNMGAQGTIEFGTGSIQAIWQINNKLHLFKIDYGLTKATEIIKKLLPNDSVNIGEIQLIRDIFFEELMMVPIDISCLE